MSKKDRIRLIAVSAVLLVVIIVTLALTLRTQYAVLYYGLSAEESGTVLAELENRGVRPRISGNTISVPENQKDRLLMELASSGVNSKSRTYEFYAMGSGVMITQDERQYYAKVQTQEDLQNAIRWNPSILDAMVLLDIPKTSSFSGAVPASSTASVMLRMSGNTTLTAEQVAAIVSMVSGAVTGLPEENVKVVDSSFRNLSDGFGDLTGKNIETVYEMQKMIEDSALQLLAPIVEMKYVSVMSYVELDFSEESSQLIEYFPATEDELTGIAASIQTITENAVGYPYAGGVAGIDDNGGAEAYPETEGDLYSQYSHETRTINYNVTEKITNFVKETGKRVDISLAVVFDSARAEEIGLDLAAMQRVLAMGLGLGLEQVNRVEITTAPFQGRIAEEEAYAAYLKSQRIQTIIDLVVQLLPYLTILLCVIMILARIFGVIRRNKEAEREALEAMERLEMEKLAMARMQEEGDDEEFDPDNPNKSLRVKKSPTRERIEEFIDKSPEAVASLLRTWLSEEKPRGRR